MTAAYELFAHNGVQAVGVDAIIERSGVARQTLYRHFGSKQELVLAFLERREEVWTYGWLASRGPASRARPSPAAAGDLRRVRRVVPRARLRGLLVHQRDARAPGADHPLHLAAAGYLARIRAFLEELATDAGIADPASFAREWHILMKGSIVAAGEGDLEAARRAKRIGRVLLAQAPRSRRPAGDSDGSDEVVHRRVGSRRSGAVSPVRTKPRRS